jgi:hypothetical protein
MGTNDCNIFNIPIYFYNIYTKHLQNTSETSETLETYAFHMCFQRNIYLLLGRWEACRREARCCGVAHSSGGEGRQRVAAEWPGGEEAGWRAAERSGHARGGGRRSGVVALEHARGGGRRSGVVALEHVLGCADAIVMNGEER